MNVMFCVNCGNEMQEGLNFCPYCGTPSAVAPAQQPPAQNGIPSQPFQQYQNQVAAVPVQQNVPAQQMPQQAVQQYQQPMQGYPQQRGLSCPVCGGSNIQVQIVELGQQTTRKGTGFGGNVNNMARGTAAVMTLGVSNLFWKKSEGTNKTTTLNATMAVCQQCGNTWELKRDESGPSPSSIFW